jgi:hypothetical protein
MKTHYAHPINGSYHCRCGFVSRGETQIRAGDPSAQHSTATRIFAPDGTFIERDDCCRCGPPNPPPPLPICICR